MHNPPLKDPPARGRSLSKALRPAFSSTWQALGFVALVTFALILPMLLARTGRLTRRDSYELMPESEGPYSFVENEIFNDDRDIDILFLGNSVLWTGIDTPLVQQTVIDRFHKPLRVVTFGSNWTSMDIPYFQLRDAVERKRISMVVLSIPRFPFNDGPPPPAFRFLDQGVYGKETEGLPLNNKLALYACNVLRAPHDLLSIARPNRSQPSPYLRDLGAYEAELGWVRDPAAFQRFAPPPPRISAEGMIYSAETQNQFEFGRDPLPFYHQYFLRKLVALLNQRHIPLMFINIPQFSERHNTKVLERVFWPESIGVQAPVVGVPPATLFANLSEDEIRRMYYDEHMNKNGSEFFTRTVVPGILNVYAAFHENK